jgi:hypothetical protein
VVWAGLGVVLLGAAVVSLLQAYRKDSFGFLEERSPVAHGVMAPIEVLRSGPAPYQPPQEYRIYSWQADFFEVKRSAESELPRLGFEHVEMAGDDLHYSSWQHKDGRWVWLETGRSRNKREAFAGKKLQDPAWVTVIVSNDTSDNWVTWLRLQFEPSY